MESLTTFSSGEFRMLLESSSGTASVCRRVRLVNEIRQVLRSVKGWPAVDIQTNRNGNKFFTRGIPFGRLRCDGRLDAAVSTDVRDRLLAEEMAARDPDEPRSDRVVWVMRTPEDVARSVWLLRLAYLSLVRE